MVDRWVNEGARGRYVCVTGVHGVMEGLRNPEVRFAHNGADACVPDGMPMTWVGRFRGHRKMHRVYGPDLMLELLELSADRGYTNYFYGGAEGVAGELRDRMTARFERLKVVGTYCPPFRPLNSQERNELIADVEEKRPDFFGWV